MNPILCRRTIKPTNELGLNYLDPNKRISITDYFADDCSDDMTQSFQKDPIRVKYRIVGSSGNVSVLKDLVSKPHPVVSCYCTAYSEHYPLIVSPDHIWMMIAQGLSHHLQLHKEYLENIQHREIAIQMPRYVDYAGCVNWAGVIDEIQGEIDKSFPSGDLIDFIQCNFSTTTQVEKTASTIVLMDALKDCFTYRNDFLCGLPSVTLLGTLADWQKIRSNVSKLTSYGMTWWSRVLLPIIDKIIQTAESEDDNLCDDLKQFGIVWLVTIS